MHLRSKPSRHSPLLLGDVIVPYSARYTFYARAPRNICLQLCHRAAQHRGRLYNDARDPSPNPGPGFPLLSPINIEISALATQYTVYA